MYLPLSLPLVFTESTALLTAIILTVSLPTHAAAVLAWISLAVAREGHTKRRLTPRLVAVAFGVLAFFAASLFIGGGWMLSWGSLTIVVAGIFAIAGAELQEQLL
jgi:fatty acid desaturase